MHNFKELKVWQNSRLLVKEVDELTSSFPSAEKYGLISQLNRCTVAIPTNISEGCGRNTHKDFAHFLNRSLGSAYEFKTLIILSYNLQLIEEQQLKATPIKIIGNTKNDFGLIKTLRQESYL
jgi:four helix bundle protein